jgi:hypothetical protein
MVSNFAVAQCGQVMMDSRIMILPEVCSPVGWANVDHDDVHPSSMVQVPPVEAEGNQRETQDQRRDQHIIGLGEPSSQSDRAEHDDEQRRQATYRCKDGADCTGRNERTVTHGRFNLPARTDSPRLSSRP